MPRSTPFLRNGKYDSLAKLGMYATLSLQQTCFVYDPRSGVKVDLV
jgi:hypothetical protein